MLPNDPYISGSFRQLFPAVTGFYYGSKTYISQGKMMMITFSFFYILSNSRLLMAWNYTDKCM